MRKLLQILFSVIFLSTTVSAQTANNWINFNQVYYKIPVAKDGVYRLTYSDLQNQGFPVNSVDPRFIQLFHRGVEQAIYFQHNQQPADSEFESGEFLEFYGHRNDGTLDSKLYKPNSAQPHPYYNLYSDTAAYFLTWTLFPPGGKRMVPIPATNNNTVPPLPKETSQTNQQLAVYTQEYSGGYALGDLIQYSYFNQGEGWTGPVICTLSSGCTGQQDFVIENLTGRVTSASPPQLQLQLAGRDDLNHYAEVYVGANAGALRLATTQSFVDFETPTINTTLNWSDIGPDGKMTVRVKALGVGGIRDRMSVSYIKVDFAQNFDMTGLTEKKFKLAANPGTKSYVEITNAPSSVRVWDITDLNNISTNSDPNPGSILKLVVPNTSVSRTLLVTKADQFMTPTVRKISFRQINPALHDYLIITNKILQKPGLGYANAVQAFAAYRASEPGGSYDTLTVTTEQLYNQFNYGETSSLAIYEFMKYMYAGGKPKYLFIIGKGRDTYSGYFRKTTPDGYPDLVPTAGQPASDAAFTAGLSGTEHLPAVPTGRITARNAAEVAAYLNKVIETETSTPTDLWHKQVLHLSGGTEPYELTLFKQYMNGFASIAEGDFYGATVKTLGKHEAAPVELINIAKEVNSGTNLVTFYGHSAPNTTDIDIGNASDPLQGYNNPGKYPVFLVNGCNAGEFFANMRNFGEDWILTANKGARNFIANSSYGYSNLLRYYTELFYSSAFADSAGIRSGIGNVHLQTAKKYLANSTDVTAVAMSHQMVLLGDPALKIFGPSKPDFEISNQSLFALGFDGNPVTASADSFALNISIKNYGPITKDKLRIRVTRKLADNSEFTYDSLYKTQPSSQDTIVFVIRSEAGKSFANNVFTVVIDPANAIAELNKANNKGSFTLTIPGTKNLFPDQYSISGKRDVELVFQNTNMLSTDRQYSIELDTTYTFTSPFVKKFSLKGKSVMRQKIQLLERDSTVYYWRTRIEQPTADENTEWRESSFAYIKSSPAGWTQMHFPQFLDDATSGLIPDPAVGKLKFAETSTDLFIKTFGKDNPSSVTNAAFTVDGVDYWRSIQFTYCRNNTINLVAFNKNTVVPYLGVVFSFHNSFGRSCGREPYLINSFLPGETATGQGDDLVQYVDNINAGDSVLLFTIGDAGLNLWSSAVRNKLAEFGISGEQIDGIQAGEPVIIFGRKGAPSGKARIIKSDLSPATAQQLAVNKTIKGNLPSGSLQSALIGPAQKWKQFLAKIADKEASDDVRFDLYGVRPDGSEVQLQSNMGNSFDLSGINVNEFPFLRLVYFTNDNNGITPVQLKKWFILFDPVAEGFVYYKGQLAQQTFQEGVQWKGNFSFINISEKQFTDSLKVETEFFNKKNQTLEKGSFKIKAPAPGDSSHFQITSYPKAGVSNVDVFVNRRVQQELFYDNNSIVLTDYLNVTRDEKPPVMDLTIDGRYLQNGDYVSANPSIVLLMKDENPYLFKTDTIGMDVYMKSPCAKNNCEFKKITFRSADVKWYPASATNYFKIEFHPRNLPDGEYILHAQLQDATGNKTGSSPFEIKFNVLSEGSVIFSPAFPNPSSTDFSLKFTLTGPSELTDFSLQIWSAAGRLINSYDKESLTELYIGTHELKWEAKDTAGNAVPPGVYIYKIRVGTNGVIKENHGKFVLIR